VMESIETHKKTLAALNMKCEISVKQIRAVFAQIRGDLDKRENELLSEAEIMRMQKEKQLSLQKESLEMFSEGMRCCGEFTKRLIEKGSQIEVAMSKKSVMSRLSTLSTVKIDLTPCHDSLLKFSEAGLEPLKRVITQFGSMSGNQTSHTTSYIERKGKERGESTSVSLNEEVEFTIISLNKEGEKIQRGGDSFVVHVDGPSKTEVSSLLFFCFLLF
jgi:hypothetical protein